MALLQTAMVPTVVDPATLHDHLNLMVLLLARQANTELLLAMDMVALVAPSVDLAILQDLLNLMVPHHVHLANTVLLSVHQANMALPPAHLPNTVLHPTEADMAALSDQVLSLNLLKAMVLQPQPHLSPMELHLSHTELQPQLHLKATVLQANLTEPQLQLPANLMAHHLSEVLKEALRSMPPTVDTAVVDHHLVDSVAVILPEDSEVDIRLVDLEAVTHLEAVKATPAMEDINTKKTV